VYIKPGFVGKFVCEKLQNRAKIGEIWPNSSSQKIPGLMSYEYLTVELSKIRNSSNKTRKNRRNFHLCQSFGNQKSFSPNFEYFPENVLKTC